MNARAQLLCQKVSSSKISLPLYSNLQPELALESAPAAVWPALDSLLALKEE